MAKKKAKAEKEEKVSSGGGGKYKHPVLLPSRVDIRPPVRATVKLAAPVSPLLEFTVEVLPSATIRQLSERIVERHGGSIKDLSICVNRFHPEEILAPEKRLEEFGVTDDCVIYYDFVPIGGPLLA
jgi:hypothetical protein